jgi:hypothetical protein
MIKCATIDIIKNKWMKAEKNQINIVSEMSNLFTNITLCCLFGSDLSNLKVPQREKGEEKLQYLGDSMIQQVEASMEREFQPHLLLFQELSTFYFSKQDKELAFNQD